MNYKAELVTISALAEQKGFVNAYEGNFSIIDREAGRVYITPSATRKLTLTEEQVAVIDLEGQQLEGSIKASSEAKMHLATYRLRPDCGAVVHSHCNFMTAYAMCGMPIEGNCHEEFLLTREIPCLPYGKAGTEAIYHGLENVISDHDLVLLGNHGVLGVGPTLAEAFRLLEAMENTVKSYTIAKLIGTPCAIPAWEELKRATEKGQHRNW